MIRFNTVSEFVHELACNPPQGDLIRLTKQTTETRFPPGKIIAVLATYRQRDGDIVKLERHCGGVVDGVDHSADDRANEVVEEISAACAAMGYETRSGRIEDD